MDWSLGSIDGGPGASGVHGGLGTKHGGASMSGRGSCVSLGPPGWKKCKVLDNGTDKSGQLRTLTKTI